MINFQENSKYKIKRTSYFKRNYKKIKKQGKDVEKLKVVVSKLANGLELESDWNLNCSSFNECPSWCSNCPSDCPTQGGDSSTTYMVLVVNGPNGGVTGWKIGTSEYIWVRNGDYTDYSVYGTASYKIGTDTGVEGPNSYVYEEERTTGSCGGCNYCGSDGCYSDCPYEVTPCYSDCSSDCPCNNCHMIYYYY